MKLEHSRRVFTPLVFGLAIVGACESPSDLVVDPPTYAPVEEGGRFRVTFGAGPDVVRGFLADGRLLFRTYDLPPFGKDWLLVSAPLDGGQIREELAVYRPALIDDMSHLAHDGAIRVLVLWKPAVPGVHGCPDSSLTMEGNPGPAPRTPSPVGVSFYALPADDGTPIASIPSRFVSTNLVEGTGTIQQRVRVHPVLRDADRTGTNAFGPVIVAASNELIYSDGEFLWRASIIDTSMAPTLLGNGAYPSLSPDGRLLAFARAVGLDSVVTTFRIPLGLAVCVEEHVEITASEWEVVVRDLESGTETPITQGREPIFDPLGSRLLVRGAELRWVDLVSGATTPIPTSSGALAAAFSADGGILAFSVLNAETDTDVYFLRLVR